MESMVEAGVDAVSERPAGAANMYLVAALVVSAYVIFILARGQLGMSSYKAFYCAGSIIHSGGNPYALEPLRSCEHAVYASKIFPAFAAEPAPLPTYALAGFALLALLPASASHVVYVLLMIAALFLAAWAVAEVSGFPSVSVLLIFLPTWIISLAYGEIPTFALAAIALSGLALERKRPVLAAFYAAAAMIQPHLALPLCIALFIGVRKTRIPLLAAGAVLALIGVAAGGFASTVAYYTTYLPAHAASEVIATDQYSLTHVLHVAGVADGVALKLGGLSYVVMAVLGILAGIRLSRALASPALLAYAPPAFALFAGSFVHDIQMAVALPFALTLLARAQHLRWLIAIAAAVLCVTWSQVGSRLVIACIIIASYALGTIVFAGDARRTLKAVILACVMVAAVFAVNRLPGASMAVNSTTTVALEPDAPASLAWNALIRASPFWSVPTPRSEGRKVPTWIGLFVLAVAGLRRKPRRVQPLIPSAR